MHKLVYLLFAKTARFFENTVAEILALCGIDCSIYLYGYDAITHAL